MICTISCFKIIFWFLLIHIIHHSTTWVAARYTNNTITTMSVITVKSIIILGCISVPNSESICCTMIINNKQTKNKKNTTKLGLSFLVGVSKSRCKTLFCKPEPDVSFFFFASLTLLLLRAPLRRRGVSLRTSPRLSCCQSAASTRLSRRADRK